MNHLAHDSFTTDAGDASPTIERGKSRDSVLFIADMQVEGRATHFSVRVRNLSPGGLMAEFDRPIPMGATVTIDLRGIGKVGGTVAWATQGRIGVALDREIDPGAARKPVSPRAEDKMLDRPIKPILP